VNFIWQPSAVDYVCDLPVFHVVYVCCRVSDVLLLFTAWCCLHCMRAWCLLSVCLSATLVCTVKMTEHIVGLFHHLAVGMHASTRAHDLHRWLHRGCLPPCKILFRSDKGFRFRACATSRTIVYSAMLFWGSNNHLQPRRHHGHQRKIRQKTRFCASMCLLLVAKPYFNRLHPLFL